MAEIPDPDDIYRRAQREGERRLSMPVLEAAATAFIAGVTVVFGIAALGIVESLVHPGFSQGPAKLAGALAFGIGLVLVVVGRTELFTENFFDPVAAAIGDRRRSPAARTASVLRLWTIVLVLNLVGGAVMAAILSIPGALPAGAGEALIGVAEDVASRDGWATFARGMAAGTLLTLLSYLLHAVDSAGARAALAFLVGFLVALGPLDHVVVSGLHILFGIWLGGDVGYGDLASSALLSGLGNVIGGVTLMTLTHAVQEVGARRSR